MDPLQRQFYAEMARVELARRSGGCSTSAQSFPETGRISAASRTKRLPGRNA
jgi:hypothetical protein